MTDADIEAAAIIELALMLKQRRLGQIKSMGFTEATALRHVLKRRRSLVGDFIGTTVIELLGAIPNRTQTALRLITEHDVPVTAAARILKLDRRTITRLVPAAKKQAKDTKARTEEFAKLTEVRDMSPQITQGDNESAALIYLPENPPA